MQFRAMVPGIEIRGLAVDITMVGFRILPSIARRYFIKHGLLQGKLGEFDPQAWYPQEAWLKVFEDIYTEVGPNSTREMGQQLGSSYPLPPEVKDIEAVLRYLDIGYHLSHRRHGQLMYNQATGAFLEGIGHYAFQTVPGKREATLRCDNPYPCDFDLGVADAIVRRIETRSRADHAPGPCRKDGADSCAYRLYW